MVKIEFEEEKFLVKVLNEKNELIGTKEISENGDEIGKKEFCLFLIQNRKYFDNVINDVNFSVEEINYKKAEYIKDILECFKNEYIKQNISDVNK